MKQNHHEITKQTPCPSDPLNGVSTGASKTVKADRAIANKPIKFSNLVVYRSVRNDIPLILAFGMISSVATWVMLTLTNALGAVTGHNALIIFMLVLSVLFSLLCLFAAFRRYNARYLIGRDGVQALTGFLSNNQIDSKLEYHQIRGTKIYRSLFERLAGTGDLVVRGSTGSDTEVAFKGIRDPYRYQKLIQTRHRLETQKSKALWLRKQN